METLVRPAELPTHQVSVKNGTLTVTKFHVEEIPNPLVRGKGDNNPHLVVTPYDGMKPNAEIPAGVDKTGYALPNKCLFMLEPLNRPVKLYRKEMASDGKTVWVNFGYDPNTSLMQLINLRRIEAQQAKEQQTSDSILAASCDTPAQDITYNVWQRFLLRYRIYKLIDEKRVNLFVERHGWVYKDNV